MVCRVVSNSFRDVTLILSLLCGAGAVFPLSAMSDVAAEIKSLIADGSFTEAEKRLRTQLADPAAPATSDAAIQLEILRRTRQDFPYSSDEVLAQLRESIPDVTNDDLDRWREAGDLQYREIDGEKRYFRQAVSNL